MLEHSQKINMEKSDSEIVSSLKAGRYRFEHTCDYDACMIYGDTFRCRKYIDGLSSEEMKAIIFNNPTDLAELRVYRSNISDEVLTFYRIMTV